MVYDPIHGCVRSLRFNEEDEREIIDRIDLLEIIANANQSKLPPIKRGKLRFMIGLQRSGKSTWANKWVRDKPRVDSDGVVVPRVIVCADDIRLAVSGKRFNRHAESVVFMIKDYMIKSLLIRGHDVLCDGTHTTKTSIRRNFEIDLDAEWTLINTPVEICKQRAIETNQPDLVQVLDRTGRQLKALLDEGIPQVCETLKEEVRARWNINNTITEKKDD